MYIQNAHWICIMHCQIECILNDLELVKITESDTLGRKKMMVKRTRMVIWLSRDTVESKWQKRSKVLDILLLFKIVIVTNKGNILNIKCCGGR